jgi:hypothetical protein
MLAVAAVSMVQQWKLSIYTDKSFDKNEIELEIIYENDSCVDVAGTVDPFLHCVPY